MVVEGRRGDGEGGEGEGRGNVTSPKRTDPHPQAAMLQDASGLRTSVASGPAPPSGPARQPDRLPSVWPSSDAASRRAAIDLDVGVSNDPGDD